MDRRLAQHRRQRREEVGRLRLSRSDGRRVAETEGLRVEHDQRGAEGVRPYPQLSQATQ